MDTTLESRVYRVEAFIIPKANCVNNRNSDIYKTEDVKFSNKLKLQTSESELIEKMEGDLVLSSDSNNTGNLNSVETELLESVENLDTSDESKKDSINSFNEYQEEPDIETLIKSPELRESYSNQIEGNEVNPSSTDQSKILPGLKKCLAEFLEDEKKSKIKEDSFIIEREEESNIIVDETEKNEISVSETKDKKIQEKKIDKKLKKLKTGKFSDFHMALKLEDPIYDEPFVGNFSRDPKESRHILDPEYTSKSQGDKCIIQKTRRCNSLKSIDEGVEILDCNLEDICYHGHKNGCTVTVQKPEDVSQDIFKENWMQRLEMLRQREALLRDKEIALESRERLHFKKEKELRILERMVKDKMRQAELYLKRCKNSQSSENVFHEKNIDSKSSDGVESSKPSFVLKVANTDKRAPFVGEGLWLKAPELKYNMSKENVRNPPPSRSCITTLPSDQKYGSKFSAYSSFRCKPRPKISYDDLDSTLSADVGDASYVVTSRKFDPVVFKKPAAFSRSASERRPRTEFNSVISKEKCQNEEYPTAEFEEDKIIRKVSENILVAQDKDTKYQDYGIIDNNVKTLDRRLVKSDEEEKKSGYLNLEVDDKKKRKNMKGLKTRPTSWSAETDDWLKKKREAYNSANKKCVANFDKENLELNSKGVKHTTPKKSHGKGKKFSIFR